MRVLITGGSGMVGRNLLEHAGAKNHEVLAPISAQLNLKDSYAVSAYLEEYRPDIIVHSAGKVGGIQANLSHPVAFLLDNLDMGRNLVATAHQAGITRLLNLGSSCMYPRTAPNPLTEDAVLKGELEPTNEGYALAKIAVARLCQYINREFSDFQYKTLIPCNLYGRYDKFDPGHSHLVAAIIDKLHQAGRQGVTRVDIWGDGTARREFMYAGDLADCIWRAVDDFESLPDCMNVGMGSDLTVNDYYQVAAEVIGYQGTFVHDPSKPVGMKQKLVDTRRADEWGWKARTTLREGLRLTYQHYLQSNPT
jgi:GDP-L-fucose synthase